MKCCKKIIYSEYCPYCGRQISAVEELCKYLEGKLQHAQSIVSETQKWLGRDCEKLDAQHKEWYDRDKERKERYLETRTRTMEIWERRVTVVHSLIKDNK